MRLDERSELALLSHHISTLEVFPHPGNLEAVGE
jgi:hypothetical protein